MLASNFELSAKRGVRSSGARFGANRQRDGSAANAARHAAGSDADALT
jgi:hypothetical protein